MTTLARVRTKGDRLEPRAIYSGVSDRRRRARRRKRGKGPAGALALAVVVGLALVVWAAARAAEGDGDPARERGIVQIVADRKPLLQSSATHIASLRADRLRRWLGRLPSQREERRGRVQRTLALDRHGLMQQVRAAARAGGGTVPLPERPVAAQIRLPIVQQALRNNCETAALSMLLAARGVRLGQLYLQRGLAKSGPVDPQTSGPVTVWGDPRKGFVGRPDGGGPAGGYGVYAGPIRDLAATHEVSLRDLGRRPAKAIYRTLLRGRPVMAWVGLSDGPFTTWRTSDGETVRGNFGEHTVVLTGLRGDQISVNDPLYGERTTWSRDEFELMWSRLGRRALAA